MEEQTKHLERKNSQLSETQKVGITHSQSISPGSQESPSSLPGPPSETGDDEHIANKAHSLFQQFVKAQTFSVSLREPSADYPWRDRREED